MLVAKLNEFIHALLFGNNKYKLPDDLLITQHVLNLGKRINVENTFKNGGLLLSHYIIQKDLDGILNYINNGNQCYYDGKVNQNEPLKLQSAMIKQFFNELSVVCRGDLEFGATANRNIPENTEKFYKRNRELISVESTPKHYHNALKLYDMKCKSIGEILDPFNFVLTPHTTFVDPVHWESTENLIEFIKHFPSNALVVTIRNLLYVTIYSILDANEELFPKDIFGVEEENAIHLFLENINFIDSRVERVDSDNAPPKLIDLFHRLLALSKLDKLWIKTNVSKKHKVDSSLCNIYTKLVDLENENKLLRNEISSN